MADSNMRGFSRGLASPSRSPMQRRQMMSFQPGAAGMAAAGGATGPNQIQIGGGGGYGGFVGGGNMSALVQTGPSPNHVQIEPVVGDVNREQGLTSDWSVEEQSVLNRELIKHAAAEGMAKYIKVAVMLPRKTVRDVAMRCQYVAGFEKVKRQKVEEHAAKKKKGKVVEANTNMVTSGNILSNPPCNQNGQFSSEDAAFYGANQQLMDQNNLMLAQIQNNIVTMKIQENVDLFNRVRDNIKTVLYNMSQMQGKMSQMPPLQASLQEDLLNAITYLQNQQLVGMHESYLAEQQRQQQRQ